MWEGGSDYLGLSSWQAFKAGKTKFEVHRISRIQYRKLSKGASDRQKRAYARELRADSCGDSSYTVDLKAAFNAFSSDETYKQFREEILDRIQDREDELIEERKRDNKKVLGVSALYSASMHKAHTPKKFGKRMICLGSTKQIRKEFIDVFRQLGDECAQAYKKILAGCRSTLLPPGFYMPGRVKYVEALPGAVI